MKTRTTLDRSKKNNKRGGRTKHIIKNANNPNRPHEYARASLNKEVRGGGRGTTAVMDETRGRDQTPTGGSQKKGPKGDEPRGHNSPGEGRGRRGGAGNPGRTLKGADLLPPPTARPTRPPASISRAGAPHRTCREMIPQAYLHQADQGLILPNPSNLLGLLGGAEFCRVQFVGLRGSAVLRGVVRH